MTLAEICTASTLKGIGKLALITGIAVQATLPNLAFLTSIVKPDYAEKMYDYSALPYILIGGAVDCLMLYLGEKVRK